MTDNVIQFTGNTLLDIAPDQVLEEAKGQCLSVYVFGYTPEDDIYVAGSNSDLTAFMWALKKAEHALMIMDED